MVNECISDEAADTITTDSLSASLVAEAAEKCKSITGFVSFPGLGPGRPPQLF
jgi:hypothetical protein